MNANDNYKYLFFKEMYEQLNLKYIEEKLTYEKINSLNIQPNENYQIISHYFFLLNEVNTEKLTTEQLQKFQNYFSKKINLLTEEELKEIKKFINETYHLVLFPNIEDTYIYYGPINDNYICPRDAIAIGLYYDVFTIGDDFETQNKLSKIINYIQFDLAKKINKKVSVLLFNQLNLQNKNNNYFKKV